MVTKCIKVLFGYLSHRCGVKLWQPLRFLLHSVAADVMTIFNVLWYISGKAWTLIVLVGSLSQH
jgi:hypothetical protein